MQHWSVLCYLLQCSGVIKSQALFIFYEMNISKICDDNRGSLPHMLGLKLLRCKWQQTVCFVLFLILFHACFLQTWRCFCYCLEQLPTALRHVLICIMGRGGGRMTFSIKYRSVLSVKGGWRGWLYFGNIKHALERGIWLWLCESMRCCQLH